jgi:5-methylcytosine-specific restriction endonuclease McrA
MEEKAKRVRIYSDSEKERRREAERKRMENPEYRERKRLCDAKRLEDKEIRARKQAMDRERAKTPDVSARKLEISKRFRQTDKYKEWAANHQKRVSEKNRSIFWRKYAGRVCEVLLINCPLCAKIEVKKKPSYAGYAALNCCLSCAKSNPWHGMKQPVKEVICKDCGATCIGKGRRMYCDMCRDARVVANEARYGRMYGTTIESRARKRGVVREKVIKDVVFERDCWKCCDCGITVVRSRYYQRNQATIDHTIPLSKGGSHTYSNVRTLCMPCNTAKADRLIGEYVVGITSTGKRVGTPQ